MFDVEDAEYFVSLFPSHVNVFPLYFVGLPELLDFKLRILQRQGIKINAPYIAHGDFLKRDLGQPLN